MVGGTTGGTITIQTAVAAAAVDTTVAAGGEAEAVEAAEAAEDGTAGMVAVAVGVRVTTGSEVTVGGGPEAEAGLPHTVDRGQSRGRGHDQSRLQGKGATVKTGSGVMVVVAAQAPTRTS